ncbi:TNF receptor-associated factor 6 [Achroia grisella]|uniref:TNF receptor-associated factor 6 n=1 Tax=Achroia grisella TaxID=688607 RepID=UPI0027D30DB8|nr:TNF receptor-associated factor 6 [Achroia grisella]
MEQPNKNASEGIVPLGITPLNDSNSELNQPKSEHECPICCHWLRDPVQTSCGHRFCIDCIVPWIKNSGYCPLDNDKLGMENIFPDNFVKREILNLTLSCPNSSKGCKATVSPLDFESHLESCKYNLPQTSSQPEIRVPCSFHAVGCKETFNTENDMSNHLNNDTQNHLSYLMNAYSELKMSNDMSNANIDAKEQEAMVLWDAPDKNNPEASSAPLNNTSALIRSVFERVVILEQRNREQAICIANLTKKVDVLSALTNYNHVRYCMGNYIWKIECFKDRLQKMSQNHNSMLYSPGFYTSPYGYRFCLRLNISPQNPQCFALHVHMMRSEHDNSLEWPFNGRISFAMINQYDSDKTQKDTMMSISHLTAFKKPTLDICPRGFGYTTYAMIEDVVDNGFVKDDTLIIRVQIKCV